MNKIFIDSLFLDTCASNFLKIYQDRKFQKPSLNKILKGALQSIFNQTGSKNWEVVLPICEDAPITKIMNDLAPFSSDWGNVTKVSNPTVELVRFELEEMILNEAHESTDTLLLMIGTTGHDYPFIWETSGHLKGRLQKRGSVIQIRDREQPNPPIPNIVWQDYVLASVSLMG